MTVELIGWLAGSSRFRAFAGTYRDKIHKKLRNASDPEAARDVRAELQVARLLLADRRFEVAFEAYGSGKVGPDLDGLVPEHADVRRGGDETPPRAGRRRHRRRVDGQAATADAEHAQRRGARDRRRHGRGGRRRRRRPARCGRERTPRTRRSSRPGVTTGAAASTSAICGSELWSSGARVPSAMPVRPSGRTGRLGSPCRIRRRGRAWAACAS